MPNHPLFVHVPIALAVLMPLVSLGLVVAWWRGWLPRRSWWLAVGLQAALVGSSLLALRTGHAEGERVEDLAGEARVEAHEEAAEVFVWGAAAMLAIAVGAALVRRERAAQALAGLAVAASVGVFALGYRTGRAGGQLVYGDGGVSKLSAGGAAGVAAGETGAEADEGGGQDEDGDDD